MSSTDQEDPEQIFALVERFFSNRDFSLFLPFLLGFAESPPSESSPQAEETTTTGSDSHPRGRIILINPFTQGMIVIEGGTSSLDSILHDLSNKGGHPPASKSSIEALKELEISGEELDGECSICLENWEIGEKIKVMPCKHKFHSNCIEKWLGMHGSCPVCRHKMPIEEDEEEPKASESDIRVSFSYAQTPSNEE